MKKLLALTLLLFSVGAHAVCNPFTANTVLTAGALNSALSAGCVTSGTIDGTVIGGATPAAITATTGAFSGVVTSNVATGTAPFTVTSTTPVANLAATTATNVSGGSVNATTGAFSGVVTSTVATGTAPFTVTSTTPVANLSIGGNAATATTATMATTATNLSGGTVNATKVLIGTTDNGADIEQINGSHISLGPNAAGYNYTAMAFGGTTGVPNAAMAFKSARGTSTTPTATQSGDIIGNIDAFGYGTASGYAASIDIVAAGTFSATSWPTGINFNTTAVGAIIPTKVMGITSAGVAITGTLSSTGTITAPTITAAGTLNAATVNATGAVTNGATGKIIINTATAPTVASGFGTSPTVSTANGTAAFKVNIGTGGIASSGVLTFPTGTTDWICAISNPLTGAGAMTVVSSQTTTSITLTNYTIATNAALAWSASTVIGVLCHGE